MKMTMSEMWDYIHTERRDLAGDLCSLRATEWETPSLCPGWSVHDVLAHLTDTARTGKIAFMRSMLRARGDFHLANENGIKRWKYEDPRETLHYFLEARFTTKLPPAHPSTRLVEMIVHAEDIRRPLSIPAEYPTQGIHEALKYQLRTSASFDGGKERTQGLHLIDAENGTSFGSGDDVTGRGIDLLLAVSGRAIDPDLLTGPGAHKLV
ncbi:maleylpyruvate isomerase family mycothiol-dependent enzyme [Corynebacterium lubricantis]|uniref:maleylpyruvate isomerase family mycothiol-dependent enzyme n=1 Tax=Corynebacterium lubricantis TaxID=541095 RepID=UPI0003A0B9B4|nr:maleylpyruvate isomerase family mycothiol-dependent enzyme [Corynebacterium lubricantis]